MTATPTALDTDVLIAGAGPVGMTLALCLARRGVRCTVVEMRPPGALPDVKCNHVSARSMELFRQLGVAQAVRAAGLPDDYPHDVSYRTATTGREVTRIRIPGRAARANHTTDTSGPDGWWPTPEPPHRVNQRYLEPTLFAHAQSQPNITFLHRHQVLGYTQHDDHVVLDVQPLDGDAPAKRLTARYLAGCDGGRSVVRRTMGAKLVGDEVVQRVQSTCIRAPGLLALLQEPPAWAMFTVNPRRSGNVYAIDGREVWLVHNYLREDEADFDAVDRDWAIRTILGVDASFDYELLSKEDWFGRRLVTNRFADRRVFLCGDAAHLWVPYAGYGMNAGLADAANLAWHLCAQLEGWAAPEALAAYARERHPITEQVSRFAMDHAHAMTQRRRAIPAAIEDDTPEGQAARDAFGQDLYDLNVQQYCCAGLNFGYYYDDSPVVAYDGSTPPPYSMGSFTASTVPGCRAPHFWLADGRSLYDAFGPAYTLLQVGAQADTSTLMQAAAAQGVPLTVQSIADEPHRPAEYTHPLLMARADGHTVWRGAAPTAAEARALVARLCGSASAEKPLATTATI